MNGKKMRYVLAGLFLLLVAFAYPFIGKADATNHAEGELGCAAPSLPQPQIIKIPKVLYPRDLERATLRNLLLDALLDDSKGVVNLEREREIKKLALKIAKEK